VLLDNIVVALRVRLDYDYVKRKVEDSGAAGGGSTKQALYEFEWYENVINKRSKPFLCLIYTNGDDTRGDRIPEYNAGNSACRPLIIIGLLWGCVH
jgi:hypothetical protein